MLGFGTVATDGDEERDMAYAGDLTPQETWDLLAQDRRAVLVDVRTRAEWTYIGVPDLARLDREPVLVEWLSFPAGTVNPTFLDQLAVAGVDPQVPVAFLCRSGVRSVAAAQAASSAGYAAAYNVLEGFEGPLDTHRHRGGTSGWKAAGLPWRQW